ncbi:MAG TPA: hypothetical protein VGM92_08080 [Candidatus Kapabacteria bacterium]|jgi:hypothetical protein
MDSRKLICSVILFLCAAACRAQGPVTTDSLYLIHSTWPVNAYYNVWTLASPSGNFGYVWPDANANGVLYNDGSGNLSWPAITTLIGNTYIDNGSSIQTANFNISGNGVIGTSLEVDHFLTVGDGLFLQYLPSADVGILTGSSGVGISESLGTANGQIPIWGTSPNSLAWSTITAGTGITVTNAQNAITLAENNSDSGDYIENQHAYLQTGDYRISGSAYVGTNDTVAGNQVVLNNDSIGNNLNVGTTVFSGTHSNSIAGGGNNIMKASDALTTGGLNYVSGTYGVALGFEDTTSAAESFTAGQQASDGGFGSCFVWSDGTAVHTKASASNQFLARASGGFKLLANTGSTVDLALTSSGLTLANPLAVPSGGTGAGTLTAHGVILGEGTSAVAASSVGTSGQVFTSAGSADGSYSFKPAAWGWADVSVSNTGAITVNSSYNIATVLDNPLVTGVYQITFLSGNPPSGFAYFVTPKAAVSVGPSQGYFGTANVIGGTVTVATWTATTAPAWDSFYIVAFGF